MIDEWETRVRRDDPFTSKKAARSLRLNHWQQVAMDIITSFGERGGTNAEILDVVEPKSHSSIHSRSNELEKKGLVWRSRWETRPSTRTGKSMMINRAMKFVLWDGVKI